MAKWYIGTSKRWGQCDVLDGYVFDSRDEALKNLVALDQDVIVKRCRGGFLFQPMNEQEVWISTVLNPRDKKLMPYEVAEKIIKSNNIVKVGRDSNALYTYRDSYYQYTMDNEIESIIYNRNKYLKTRQRKEILSCIKLDRDIKHETVDTDYICFTNGLLRLSDMKLIKHTPKIVCTTKINHKWIDKLPRNYMSSQIMQSLYTWTKMDNNEVDDEELVQLILEMSGCCFTYDVTMQKAFIINGDKSNGKSAFMHFLQFCIGTDNYSAVDMSELGDRFTKIEVMGKLANISDDIADNFLKPKIESIMKKFITGDTIMGEFKGKDIIKFDPYATFIFTCNDIPKAGDPKGALARRFIYIPFQHTFKEEDRDMHIYEKLNTEECAEIFIHLAVNAYKKAKARGKYTASDKTKELAAKHTVDSNSVFTWTKTIMDEEDLTEEKYIEKYFIGQQSNGVYQSYKDWAVNNGFTHVNGPQSFTQLIKTRFGVEPKKRKTADEYGKRPMTYYLCDGRHMSTIKNGMVDIHNSRS